LLNGRKCPYPNGTNVYPFDPEVPSFTSENGTGNGIVAEVFKPNERNAVRNFQFFDFKTSKTFTAREDATQLSSVIQSEKLIAFYFLRRQRDHILCIYPKQSDEELVKVAECTLKVSYTSRTTHDAVRCITYLDREASSGGFNTWKIVCYELTNDKDNPVRINENTFQMESRFDTYNMTSNNDAFIMEFIDEDYDIVTFASNAKIDDIIKLEGKGWDACGNGFIYNCEYLFNLNTKQKQYLPDCLRLNEATNHRTRMCSFTKNVAFLSKFAGYHTIVVLSECGNVVHRDRLPFESFPDDWEIFDTSLIALHVDESDSVIATAWDLVLGDDLGVIYEAPSDFLGNDLWSVALYLTNNFLLLVGRTKLDKAFVLRKT